MDILSTLLSDERQPLTQKISRRTTIAKDIAAYQQCSTSWPHFIEATAAAGYTTDEITKAIDDVLSTFHQKPTTLYENDIEIAKRNWEAQFYNGLLSIQNKADRLNSYNIITGDPDSLNRT